MASNRVCELLGIEVPVLCAPFGPWDQVELARVVSEAGGLGSVGTAVKRPDTMRAEWDRLAESGARFAINHTSRPFDPEAFDATIEFGPVAISFHMAIDRKLIERAHAAGILWIHQVMDARSAEEAIEAGADVVIAQGGEAGGHSGTVSTMVLVPQVVDLAGDVPVVAAGGIADGRGMAAALALGAQGINVGTRFLATEEMAVDEEWKRMIVAADATDSVKVESSERIMPPFNMPGPKGVPRSLRTELVEQLREDPDSVESTSVGPKIIEALQAGGGHQYIAFAGQSAGLIESIEPARVVVEQMVGEARQALTQAAELLGSG